MAILYYASPRVPMWHSTDSGSGRVNEHESIIKVCKYHKTTFTKKKHLATRLRLFFVFVKFSILNLKKKYIFSKYVK